MNKDVSTRITDKIVSELEQGERPWLKPWNAQHAAGKITRPLRHNGIPYSGMNVIMLWMEAEERGYNAPIWMTYKQAKELGGHVLKGENGSLVVYANTFKKTETDQDTGEEIDRVFWRNCWKIFRVILSLILFPPGPVKQAFIGNSGIFDFGSAVFRSLFESRTRGVFKAGLRIYLSDHRPMWLEFDVS